MQDFWQASGFRLLQRNDHGWLRVTPEWLALLLHRPELAPIAESGPGERTLHAALMADPLREVAETDLAAIEDADVRENYRYFLTFRRGLVNAVTLERYYLQLFREGSIAIPPVFVDLLAHAIVRGLLDGCEDVYEVRAGEMFFRRQRVSTEGGQVLAADAETIRMFAETGGFGSVGRLLAQQGTQLAAVNMDVMSHENAQLYWLREDRYAYLLDLTHRRAGETALARLLAKWVRHFFGCEVAIEPLAAVDDAAWRWHIGLDLESTAILNDLYTGVEVEPERRARLISLFRLDFADAAAMRADVAGKPVYLGLAFNADNVLKLKPQNLLVNLPLAKTS
ncbi:MAG: hypothetical protein HY255_07175 [Betaproteobacteria bacterium]|nr:hypothetical protein [Betaproteobacteria bacterium]